MTELARCSPVGSTYRVFLVGGGTAVYFGWRESTIDVDLYSSQEAVFRDIQSIKERLRINIEFVRPEHFVPPLTDAESRHVFIDTVGRVSFFHYDPYSQLFSKVVRGFRRDLLDAEDFLASGLVDAARFQRLVQEIPGAIYSQYPALSRAAVLKVVEEFVLQKRA